MENGPKLFVKSYISGKPSFNSMSGEVKSSLHNRNQNEQQGEQRTW